MWDMLALSPPGWGGNLLWALLDTLTIAVGAFALGLTIGLSGALGKIYGGRYARGGLAVYTTVIRAVPELVLILLLYYAGSDLVNLVLEAMGIRPITIDGLTAGIVVLGIVQGAYATEVLRGAILAVPKGQSEAAMALGMSWLNTQRKVVIPQMLPVALPGLSNLWLITTKDTALLAVVGFSELALETRQAAGATRAYFMFYMVAGCLYLMVTLISTAGFSALERRYRRGQQARS